MVRATQPLVLLAEFEALKGQAVDRTQVRTRKLVIRVHTLGTQTCSFHKGAGPVPRVPKDTATRRCDPDIVDKVTSKEFASLVNLAVVLVVLMVWVTVRYHSKVDSATKSQPRQLIHLDC